MAGIVECRMCMFWVDMDEYCKNYHDHTGLSDADRVGKCHKYPPKMIAPLSESEQDDVDIYFHGWVFPVVRADEWCSMFEPREIT